MKDHGFVPQNAKSVAHEARNGIRLCVLHHRLLDRHSYYIRWFPEERVFIFINHSRSPDLEPFHGRAIALPRHDDRLPFHGAFLFHEMRVRGYWPLYGDRTITTPIPGMGWIVNNSDDNGNGDDNDNDDDDDDDDDEDDDNGGGRGHSSRGRGSRGGGPSGNAGGGGRQLHSQGPVGSSALGKVGRRRRGGTGGGGHNQGPGDNDGGPQFRSCPISSSRPTGVFIPLNPFTHPTVLQGLKESFQQQPNWKAAVMEGETWEGTADENAAKWRKLNQIDDDNVGDL